LPEIFHFKPLQNQYSSTCTFSAKMFTATSQTILFSRDLRYKRKL